MEKETNNTLWIGGRASVNDAGEITIDGKTQQDWWRQHNEETMRREAVMVLFDNTDYDFDVATQEFIAAGWSRSPITFDSKGRPKTYGWVPPTN